MPKRTRSVRKPFHNLSREGKRKRLMNNYETSSEGLVSDEDSTERSISCPTLGGQCTSSETHVEEFGDLETPSNKNYVTIGHGSPDEQTTNECIEVGDILFGSTDD